MATDANWAPDLSDGAVLSEIENLHLIARNVAQGALAGMHRSLRRGSSIEFSEHKLYTPGDDIRHIDWRAFAKTDRYHVKQFEDETNLRIELLVDHSGSMGFANKLNYAKILASAIAFIALRQGDATGLLTFAGDVQQNLPARSSSSHLVELLRHLGQLQANGPTALAPAVDAILQSRGRRAVVIILSDLFDPHQEWQAACRRLSAAHHDVSVLHLLDPREIDFDYDAPAFFASMEDARRVFVHPRTLRHTFSTEMRKFIERTARDLASAKIAYHQCLTSTPPAQNLAAFLRAR